METLKCRGCGYTWTPRPKRLELGRKRPACCPSCFSRKWDPPRTRPTRARKEEEKS